MSLTSEKAAPEAAVMRLEETRRACGSGVARRSVHRTLAVERFATQAPPDVCRMPMASFRPDRGIGALCWATVERSVACLCERVEVEKLFSARRHRPFSAPARAMGIHRMIAAAMREPR